LPETVVPDPVGLEAEGRLLPLGTVASVLVANLGVVVEGVLDGSLRAPMSGSGLEEPEGLERLAGLPDTFVTGETDVDPETDGDGREGLAGGKLADVDSDVGEDVDPEGKATTRIGGPDDEELGVPEAVVEIGPGDIEGLPEIITAGVEAVGELVVELELSETGLPTVAGLLDEDVGREDDGPVGGELNDVEADEEDELFVVMLIGLTTTEPELDELPVGKLLEEVELLVVMLIGPTTTEPELDELPVGKLLEEVELLVVMLTGPTTTEAEPEVLLDEIEELELLGLKLDELVGIVLEELEVGGAVDETVELELLGIVLDELVGNVLEELEVLVDPQPGIVV